MKQKMKEHKGITLVALILTIIVLLILAVVAISAVKGDGIISHAKNARSQYTKAQTNEQELLSNYELMLAQETGNAWKQEKTKVTKGDKTLEVGDTITNFTAGGKTWKVLGAENGKLLLTTTENVNNSFYLEGVITVLDETEKRFVAAEKALDDECKAKITLTEAEKNQVAELRSIKVEDINRVTGYNPEKTGNGKVFGDGQTYQYGNEVTYSLVKDANGTVTGVKYDSTVKSGTSTQYPGFWLPSAITAISPTMTSQYTVRSTCYWYYLDSLTGTELKTGEECKGIAKDSDAYKLLVANDKAYWLASSYVYADEGCVDFGLLRGAYGGVFESRLWDSEGTAYGNYAEVRPVVSLKSDVKLTETSTGSGEWNIS